MQNSWKIRLLVHKKEAFSIYTLDIRSNNKIFHFSGAASYHNRDTNGSHRCSGKEIQTHGLNSMLKTKLCNFRSAGGISSSL